MPCEGSFQEDYLGIAPELLQSTQFVREESKRKPPKGAILVQQNPQMGKLVVYF
jgi:hypothetical protein